MRFFLKWRTLFFVKKITVLDPADFCGGAELSLLELLQSLSQKYQFTLVESGKIKRAFPSEVQRKTMQLPRLRPFRLWTFFQKIREIRAFLRDNPTDILHSNSVRAGFFSAFSGAKKWTHFAHDTTTPRFLAFLFRRADCIFACSELVKNDLVSKGIPSEKITVVFNGIQIPQKPPRPKNSHPKIAIIGRIDPWKGHSIFLKIAQKIPEYDFLIFGNSDEHDLRTVAHEATLRKNASSNVFFRGFQKREKIFAEIDLALHLSLEPEPFGRVILESLAFGVPIFASRNEILQGNFLNDFLIDPHNPEEIVKKICDFLGNPQKQNDFRQAAERRVGDFEMTKWAEKIAQNWENL